MKRAFQSALLVAVTAVMVAHAYADPVTYNFTAKLNSGEDPYFGDTLSGTLTLDPSAAPASIALFPGAEIGTWSGGAFAINIITNTGFQAGTLDGGSTSFFNYDFTFGGAYSAITSFKDDGVTQTIISLAAPDAVSGDGAKVANPWTPLTPGPAGITVIFSDLLTTESHTVNFSVTTFASNVPVSPNILIDGKDTGITDFTYQGQSVNATIADYATSAKNHGGFVSSVTQLANALVKAGLLTNAQKSTLTSTAAQSSIGKKK